MGVAEELEVWPGVGVARSFGRGWAWGAWPGSLALRHVTQGLLGVFLEQCLEFHVGGLVCLPSLSLPFPRAGP